MGQSKARVKAAEMMTRFPTHGMADLWPAERAVARLRRAAEHLRKHEFTTSAEHTAATERIAAWKRDGPGTEKHMLDPKTDMRPWPVERNFSRIKGCFLFLIVHRFLTESESLAVRKRIEAWMGIHPEKAP
jgi:hypothetical protein